MTAKVVHDDDVIWFERWNEELLNIKQKAFPVDGPVEHTGCCDMIAAQGGKERQGFPVTMRSTTDQSLAFARPPPQWRHIGFYP